MKRTIHQVHDKNTFLYAFSRMLERASYYGLRSIIVLYMVGKVLKMSDDEALNMYGWFMGSVIFSQILGALLGDLLIGNKKALVIGGIIQSLGAFCLCIPSMTGLYMGLFLVVFGSGLYTPNIISTFGKLYLNKTKLLDAGFSIFYMSVNLGAFLGSLFVGYLGEEYGWNYGFISAGIILLLSIIPILISKDNEIELKREFKETANHRVVKISIVLLLVGIFWTIYEFSNIHFIDVRFQLSEVSSLDIPKSIWSGLDVVFTLPISLFAIVLWTYFYSSQFSKLMIGFIFCAISLGVLLLIPNSPNEQHVVLYLVSLFFLGISEIYIRPIVHSILTEYANSKYLAILVSMAFIPSRLLYFVVGLFSEQLYAEPTTFSLLIAMIVMFILSIVLFLYNWKDRTSYKRTI